MISNKKVGNMFERDFVKMLGEKGFWAHFIEPNKQGAQPFDVIAIKNGEPWVFDCKTCVNGSLSYNRLEINQISAFDKVMQHGCKHVYLAVLHGDRVHLVSYVDLTIYGRVSFDEDNVFEQVIR